MQLINITGYQYSGKGAYLNLLRNDKSIGFLPKGTEFELFRINDGLIDLRNSLVEDWSISRVDVSIKKFLKLCEILNNQKASWANPSLFFKPNGHSYSKYFPNFYKITDSFVKQITNYSIKQYWPFYQFYDGGMQSFSKKIIRNTINKKYGKFNHVQYSILDQKNIDQIIYNYIEKVFKASNKKFFIIDNGFDPSLILKYSKIYPKIKHIIVDRDPRDIYVETIQKNLNHINVDVSYAKNFIKTYDFIKSKVDKVQSKNVLKVAFEHLYLDPEKKYYEIMNFLNIKYDKNLLKSLNLYGSIGLWNEYPNKSEIRVIENYLIKKNQKI